MYLLCRFTSYVDQMSAWYDVKTKQEIVSIKMFEKLEVSNLLKHFLVSVYRRKSEDFYVGSI